MKKVFLCILGLILAFTSVVLADGDKDSEAKERQEEQVLEEEPVPEEDKVFEVVVYPTGFIEAAVELKYSGLQFVESLDTSIKLILDGGYITHYYYIYENGLPFIPPVEQADIDRAVMPMVPLNWSLGLEQGVLWNEEGEKNLLTVFASYDGRHEILLPDANADTVPLFMAAGLPETFGLTETAFSAGVIYDNAECNSHQISSGIYGRGGISYAPGFLNQISDYYRLFLDVKFLLPIVDVETEDEFNLFNMYLVSRFKVGWLDGAYMPVHARWKNMTEIRGIRNERFDSRFTCTNNTELRLQFPAFFTPGLLPMAFIYVDTAYHWEDPSYNGFLASAGAGVGLNVFDFLLLGIRTDYNIIQAALDGTKFKPIELNVIFQFY